ncbi:MAG TPA: hypothetical protein VF367_00115, partial [Candidatus Limnocylindria bacterium]
AREAAPAIPWHPVVFAATMVVSAWLDAAVSPFAALRPLLVAGAAAVVLTLLAVLITRTRWIGGVVASAAIGTLWSRQLVTLFGDLSARMGALVTVVWVALIVVVAVLILRRIGAGWSGNGVTTFLNRASLLVLAAGLLLAVVNGTLPALLPDLRQGTGLDGIPSDGATADQPPDVYVVLLDGYPRADVLEYAFDIDNTPFMDALAQRGFAVAGSAHSDYLWTHVSVPSALNLDFVEAIPRMRQVIDGASPRQPTLRRAVADNVAFEVARDAGYTTVSVASGFEEVALRQADVYLDGGQLNELEISLLTRTWLGDVLNVVAPGAAAGQQRSRIVGNLAALPEIAERATGSPILVFDHVPAPHQPIVFGADGAAVSVPLSDAYFADSPAERGESTEDFVARYRDQLPYLNERVLEAIDGILAASEEPPVIILLADHGSASVVDWNATDPDEADPARLLERTGILFAALMPDGADVFPDDISPVDTFRLLFDAYLGTDYGRATPPADGGHVSPVDASVLPGS